MKKWALAITIAVFAVVSVTAAAFALTDDDGGSGNAPSSVRDAGSGESQGDSGDIPKSCLEGAIDCNDAIDTPAGPAVCIDIFPTPPECVDPDAPVSDEPPPSDLPPSSDDPGAKRGSEPPSACTMEFPNKCTATAAAVADLAARLDLEQDAIKVVTVEFVEWPVSCLGINKTDIACAEVITPGYRIFLEANGQKYEYHTDGGSRAELVG
jgi:hypothetical protein